LHDQLNESEGCVVGVLSGCSQKAGLNYSRPFDTSRHCLLDQLAQMGANSFQPDLACIKLTDDGRDFLNIADFWGKFSILVCVF
jgi:hypothetical protein